MTCKQRPANLPRRLLSPLSRLRLFLLVLVVVGLVAAAPAPSHAEDPRKPYALIFGTVWGPDDRPVYGVKIKIRRADQKHAKWELYSDHRGEFAQRVPAGKADYVVRADSKGVKSLNGKRLHPGGDVTVHIESEERADIGLHLKR